MKDFTYGLLGSEHVWTDEGGTALGILSCLHNLYVSITQSLDNINLRCNHGLQTFRAIRQKKKRWNSITQFVFCRCIIRFFSQLCKKKTRDWFSWRLPNDSCKWEKTLLIRKPCQFSWQTLECFWQVAVMQEKLTFNRKRVV